MLPKPPPPKKGGMPPLKVKSPMIKTGPSANLPPLTLPQKSPILKKAPPVKKWPSPRVDKTPNSSDDEARIERALALSELETTAALRQPGEVDTRYPYTSRPPSDTYDDTIYRMEDTRRPETTRQEIHSPQSQRGSPRGPAATATYSASPASLGPTTFDEDAARDLAKRTSPRISPMRDVFKNPEERLEERRTGEQDRYYSDERRLSERSDDRRFEDRGRLGDRAGDWQRKEDWHRDDRLPSARSDVRGRDERILSYDARRQQGLSRNASQSSRGDDIDYITRHREEYYERDSGRRLPSSSRFEEPSHRYIRTAEHVARDVPMAVEQRGLRSIGVNTTRINVVKQDSPQLRAPRRLSDLPNPLLTTRFAEDEAQGVAEGGGGFTEAPRPARPKQILLHPSAQCTYQQPGLTRTDFAIDTDGYSCQRQHLRCPEYTRDQYHKEVGYFEYDYGISTPGKPVRIIEEKECLGGLFRWDEAYSGYIAGHEWVGGRCPPPPPPPLWYPVLFYYQSHE